MLIGISGGHDAFSDASMLAVESANILADIQQEAVHIVTNASV